ncbi:MAG: DUF3052 domain-containing protein [Anaerolineae bacterium]|nr:DUF3052 domain-containing protein [Anaerolineae bacterium]
MTAGYSKTPLMQKLGIKPGFRLIILNSPPGYAATLGPLPAEVTVAETLAGPLDFIHFFSQHRAELEANFPRLKQALALTGMLWISWPKKAAKVPTDVTDSVVREIGLANGLVDVKVAAVDEVWSGLKFMYRVKDR